MGTPSFVCVTGHAAVGGLCPNCKRPIVAGQKLRYRGRDDRYRHANCMSVKIPIRSFKKRK